METFGIIENVYSTPEKEREYAMSLRYPILTTSSAPGKTVLDMYDPCSESFLKIKQFFEERGEQIYVKIHSYRIATVDDCYNVYVHADPADYQVIISLTPNHDGNDVEHYFSHKETGVDMSEYMKLKYDPEYDEHTSAARQAAQATDVSNFDTMHVTASTPLGYNRAIVINCRKFHAPSRPMFGDTVNTARLIEIYTLCVSTQFISKELPFIWYHENVLSDNDCTHLVKLIKKMVGQDGALKVDYDVIRQCNSYKDGILVKMISSYFNKSVECTPELKELMEINRLNDMNMSINLSAQYHPQFHAKDWMGELSNLPTTFQVIVQLNDNSTGLTLYNHFNNTTKTIPAKRGSLVMYPRSWMYPVKQTRIMVGDKYLITGCIGFLELENQDFSYENPTQSSA